MIFKAGDRFDRSSLLCSLSGDSVVRISSHSIISNRLAPPVHLPRVLPFPFARLIDPEAPPPFYSSLQSMAEKDNHIIQLSLSPSDADVAPFKADNSPRWHLLI